MAVKECIAMPSRMDYDIPMACSVLFSETPPQTPSAIRVGIPMLHETRSGNRNVDPIHGISELEVLNAPKGLSYP